MNQIVDKNPNRMVRGVRPYTDINVSFNPEFVSEKLESPHVILLGVENSAKQCKANPVTSATGHMQVFLNEKDRNNVLGEFHNLEINQAISEALGDAWKHYVICVEY